MFSRIFIYLFFCEFSYFFSWNRSATLSLFDEFLFVLDFCNFSREIVVDDSQASSAKPSHFDEFLFVLNLRNFSREIANKQSRNFEFFKIFRIPSLLDEILFVFYFRSFSREIVVDDSQAVPNRHLLTNFLFVLNFSNFSHEFAVDNSREEPVMFSRFFDRECLNF